MFLARFLNIDIKKKCSVSKTRRPNAANTRINTGSCELVSHDHSVGIMLNLRTWNIGQNGVGAFS
jgi:hypothetical protein